MAKKEKKKIIHAAIYIRVGNRSQLKGTVEWLKNEKKITTNRGCQI